MSELLTLDRFNQIVAELELAGFAGADIKWSENVKPPETAEDFALEAAFVICNSGMHHAIARAIYDRVQLALWNGQSAFDKYKHPGKAAAIDDVWARREQLLADYMAADDKVAFCETLPWIGPITKYHLAKNFGAQVAKPDVHLQRLSDLHGVTAQHLCERLAEVSGFKVATVDLILWRACAVGILDGHTGAIRPRKPPVQGQLL